MNPARTLGRTGLSVAALGLGVSGPHASPLISPGATRQLIRTAAGLGVTLFDTGPAYGNGEAERRLGEAISDLDRNGLVVSTKAGIPARGQRDFTPDGIERSLAASLARLGTDHADILFLHGPHDRELTAELFGRLASLRAAGAFHYLGLCTRGPQTTQALRHDAFDVLMAPCHAELPRDESDTLARARKAGIGVVGIEAMAGARRHWRLPQSRGDLWYLARAARQALRGPAAPSAGSDPMEAMMAAFAHPSVDCVLSLTTREQHLRQNAALAGLDAGPDAA